jgi:undecaprenyl-diphosphatase
MNQDQPGRVVDASAHGLRDAIVLGVCTLLAAAALRLHAGDIDRMMFDGINALGPEAPWLWSQLSVAGLGVSALLAVSCAGSAAARSMAAMLLLLVGGGLLVHAIKSALMLDRPFAVLPADLIQVVGQPLRQRSMPSGHSALAFALATWILVGTGWWRGVRLALALIAPLVALSRVAVGAHWPSDVVTGAALGVAVAWGLHRSGLVDGVARRLQSAPGAWMVAALVSCAALGMFVMKTGYPLAVALQLVLAIAGAVGVLRWARHALDCHRRSLARRDSGFA